MIADIFYPIFTLTITILACFIRKKRKIVQGICTHTFTKALPWTPWRGGGGRDLQLTPDAQLLNRFWLFQKPMRPYFFCIIPWSCFMGDTKLMLFVFFVLDLWNVFHRKSFPGNS